MESSEREMEAMCRAEREGPANKNASSRCKTCKCDHYCQMEAYSRFFEEMSDKVYEAACSTGVNKEVTLQFCGVEVVLNPSGTFCLNDTTGG